MRLQSDFAGSCCPDEKSNRAADGLDTDGFLSSISNAKSFGGKRRAKEQKLAENEQADVDDERPIHIRNRLETRLGDQAHACVTQNGIKLVSQQLRSAGK